MKNPARAEPVAIVGIGCRFPGGITSPRTFWEFLARGGDGTGEVPPSRWDIEEYYDPAPDRPGRVYTRRGGFLDAIEQFDPAFFGISPREAAYMDPQQRLLLETTWEAFEDAGIAPGQWAGREVGVFIGLFTHDYENLHMRGSERVQFGPHSATGNSTTIAANRLSHAFDFTGPSMVVDTACSSSLVSVHLACRALRNGEARLAVAGGVNLQLVPEMTMSLCQASMLSPDGRCKSFDARANGYARADGVGMVVLKKLDEALADGDAVYGVILGSAVNQDGRSNGITVPNGAAQKQVMRAALAEAGVSPSQISYVEAHGTGTPVGDPIEAAALGEVLCEGVQSREACLLGSVKSNFGHTESAAGIAGLIKLALMLRHRQIPPNLHFETPNPDIPFDTLRLRVPVALEPWRVAEDARRVAGLNSFGFGGTNAHLVIGEAPASEAAVRPAQDGGHPVLLCLSARGEEALKEAARVHGEFLRGEFLQGEDAGAFSLSEIAGALALGREHHGHRLTVAARTREEAAERLAAHAAGHRRGGLVSATAAGGGKRLAFIFSGMGQQFWSMGRDLLEKDTVFAARIAEIDALFAKLTDEWSLLEELRAGEDFSRIDRTEIAQPAIFALQVGLAAMWRAAGVTPDLVCGHSIGEVAAAHVAGALSLDDAVRVCFHRSRLQAGLAGRGGMLAVGLGEAAAAARIAGLKDLVSVAAVNSVRGVTLAGDLAALQRLADELEGEGIFARLLNVEVPYHSPLMDEIVAALGEALREIRPRRAEIPLVSTVTGARIEGGALDAAYWNRNVREPVAFARAMAAMAGEDCGFFVEIGAHPVLATPIRECLDGMATNGAAICSLRRGEDDAIAFLDAVGQLHCRGYGLDLKALFNRPAARIPLPTYRWRHDAYWIETDRSRRRRTGRGPSGKKAHPLLGGRRSGPQAGWSRVLSGQRPAFLADHQVRGETVFPAAGYIEMALAAAGELASGNGPLTLEKFNIEAPLVFGARGEAELALSLGEGLEFSIHASASTSAGGDSETGESGAHWQRHAAGRIAANAPVSAARLDPGMLCHGLSEGPSAEASYKRLHDLGLEYGPAFRCMETVWLGDKAAAARIVAAPAVAAALGEYRLHPAMLDCCFQLLALLPGEGTFLPVSVERIVVHGRPGPVCLAHVREVARGTRQVRADLTLADGEGNVIAEITGLVCRLYEGTGAGASGSGHPWLFDRLWVAAPRIGERRLARDAGFLPAPPSLAPGLWARHKARMAQPEHAGFAEKVWPALDDLAVAYLAEALDGAVSEGGDATATPVSVLKNPEIEAQYGDFLMSSLDHLAGHAADVRRDVADARWRGLVAAHPECHAELGLIRRCGRELSGLPRSASPVVEAGSAGSVLVDHFLADGPAMAPAMGVLADLVEQLAARLPEGEVLRILDLGTGGWALARKLAPMLPAARCAYVHAVPSAEALAEARERLKAYPAIRCEPFDPDDITASEVIEAGAFDLVLAGAGVGGTASPDRIRELLAPGGLLALLARAASSPWLDLLSGALPDLLPAPLAEAPGDAIVIGGEGELFQVLLARAEEALSPPAAGPNVVGGEAGPVLLLGDGLGLAGALADELGARGCEVVRAERREIAGKEELSALLDRAFPSLAPRIVDLRHVSAPQGGGEDPAGAAGEACIALQELVNLLAARGGQGRGALWVVTNGTQAIGGTAEISLDQAPLWGFVRSVITEHNELNSRLVDLGAVPLPDEVFQLADEVLSGGDEDEIALRGARRFVSRVAPRANRRPMDGTQTDFRLVRRRRRPPSDLAFEEAPPRAPAPGEVRVRMRASGLNFKDFALLAGLLDASAEADSSVLGLEGAGIVEAVGEGVAAFKPGDEVMGLIDNSHSSPGLSNAFCLVPKPANLCFEEAAGLPIVFLSAWHALKRQARLATGESVLIHSAAGGLGLAAIEVARYLGARVLATAGSEEKRDYLRGLGIDYVGDSRSAGFAEEVLAATGGQGVDAVLNTLPAAMMEKNIAALRPGTGRLIDVSNIHYDARLDYRSLVRGASVSAFDLLSLARANPRYIGELLGELADLFAAGKLRPVPYRVVAPARLSETIHAARRAAHIGKNVVSFTGETMDMEPRLDDIPLSAEGSYLVSGGLSGFGLATAEWLADKGARQLILLGRRGGETPEAADALAGLKARGVQVHAASIDVRNMPQVQEIIDKCGVEFPPLRGVVHAAAVLRDRPVAEMAAEDIRAAMGAKAQGAWNLHRASLGQPLDFFIGYSSMTNLAGNYGQANYGAANEFIEALARHRQGRGLPALAVGLGVIGGTGIVARDEGVRAALQAQGAGILAEEQAWAAIAHGVRTGAAYVAASPTDWSAMKDFSLSVAHSPRFSLLERGDAAAGPGGAGEIRAALALAASEEERREYLAAIVAGEVAGVLGMDPANLDTGQPLPALGFDSLMAVELMVALETAVGLNMTRMSLLRSDLTTAALIEEVAAVWSAKNAGAMEYARNGGPAGDRDANGIDVTDLSDEEVDALLRQLALEEHGNA